MKPVLQYSKASVTIPNHLLELGRERADVLRWSFSNFVSALIEKEVGAPRRPGRPRGPRARRLRA